MRAIWYETQGLAEDVLTLGEVGEPTPGPGEVAVWIKASGVNPSDVKMRSGARGPMAVARQIPHSDGAGVVEGRTLLVTGGAGAVGNMAIQLARFMGAAQILATVSSPQKAEAAWLAGADEVIDYRRQDVADAVNAATEGQGVDHIVEVEFGANLSQSLAVLREHGSIATYGSEGERTPELPFYDLMMRNIAVYTVFVDHLTAFHRTAAIHEVSQALQLGALTPRIDQVFELEETADAHRRVEDGVKIGAVVVRV